MGWTEVEKERERLGSVYREMGDGELLGLQAASGDLTDAAREAVAAEMRRRGLAVPVAEGKALAREGSGVGAEGEDRASGWRMLHVFHQTFEAQAAFRLLEREEIPFAVEDRTLDENGAVVPGPAVALGLMVAGEDWNRTVSLLRREAGLFPEAVVDPRGEFEEMAEEGLLAVGEFEDVGDVISATRALEEAGVWYRTVTHDGEEWERTSVEVKEEDGDRALEALSRLLEDDASRL